MKNDYRQKLHLEPKSGWLNDPNGLCFFNGRYHVYFQYSPDSAEGKGRKCWGHFESRDMLSWRFTGTVLFPDTPEDASGVYSGCGIVKDDTLYLFYTGNVKEPGDHDYINSGRQANVILVTTKDGVNMSEKKVLLRNEDYPDFCSCHVRDPKVWEENGKYHMVLGARTSDLPGKMPENCKCAEGCVLYYVSDDLLHWKYDRTDFGHDGSYMWECPDEFRLGKYRYLSYSPQGIEHQKYIYQNVYSAGYSCFAPASSVPAFYREWDCGFDFYAPQTFVSPDGRRILIGWEGIGDIPYTNATTALGRQHCLTLPRELFSRDDGVITQQPVKELISLRKDKAEIKSGEKASVSLPFEIVADTEKAFSLTFENVLKLEYVQDEFSLKFISDSAGCGRTERYAKISDCKNIRIFADTSSIEIYLNDGETVLSSRMYPGDTEIVLSADGADGALYRLDPMEVIWDE